LKKRTNCNPFLVMRYLQHLNRSSPPGLYFDEMSSRWQARIDDAARVCDHGVLQVSLDAAQQDEEAQDPLEVLLATFPPVTRTLLMRAAFIGCVMMMRVEREC
jgi:hypothetical protein